jgi:hypothetical protein
MRLLFSLRIWIALSVLLVGNALAQALPSQVDRPAFKVGDYWVYNKLDGGNGKFLDARAESVLKIESGGYRVSSADSTGLTTVVRDGHFNLLRQEAEGYLHLAKPFYPHFAFPLSVGKTWKQKMELTWSTAPDVLMTFDSLESKVVGWDMVTVPAGNFMAIKIETSGWYNGKNLGGGWTGKVKETTWFAPDARNVVRSEYLESVGGKPFRHEINELQTYILVR